MRPDKERDMARSILPSKAGHAKQQVKRASRRAVSQAMGRLIEDPSEWDEADGLFETGQRQVRAIVNRRRSADKVKPFIRWAVNAMAEVPKESRLDHLRGVLPKGLIGSHALSHLSRLEPFDVRPRRVWKRTLRFLDRGHTVNVLRHVLEVRGGHRFVNDVLARHALIEEGTGRPIRRASVRLLLGVHDVLPFLDSVERWEHRALRHLVDALCRALWSAHCDVEAAAALLASPLVVRPVWWIER
jgi:hypothetical protein